MSASDAAPLPRLGEVFFDVRGSSRSMRLSWYADTGVAVFSIWQGGMCTGTFRLPIGDLPRMIEVLQRGPDEPRSRSRSREHSWGGREPAGTGQREVPAGRLPYPDPGGPYPADPYPDDRYPDDRNPDEPRTAYRQADLDETSAVSYVRDDPPRPQPEGHRGGPAAGGGRGGYGLTEAGPRGPDYDRGDYPQPGSDYPQPGSDYPQPGAYGQGEQYGQEDRYGRDEQYGQQEFGGDRYGGYQPLTTREPDSGGLRGEDDRYGHERFVPPYVRGAVSDYSGDIPSRPAERPEDPMPDAYRGGSPEDSGREADYLRPSWPSPGYSDGPDYRLAGPVPPHSPGPPGKYDGEAPSAADRPDPDPAGDFDWWPDDYPAWPDR